MQEFFINYGLWLLVGLLVLIGVIFLLSGRKAGGAAPVDTVVPEAPVTPVAAATPVEAPAPASAPAPQPIPVSPSVTAAPAAADDLLRMKGVGPKLNALLIELGVTSYAQIAGWSDADIAAVDARLGNFKGRPVRDQWIDQAKYLAAGDFAGFEAKYGKL